MSQAPHTPKNVVKTGTCQRLDGKERHIHAKYPQNYSPDSDSKKHSELQNDIYISDFNLNITNNQQQMNFPDFGVSENIKLNANFLNSAINKVSF